MIPDPQIIEWIETGSKASLVGPILTDTEGIHHKLSDLKKTAEYGGKGKGFGVRIEHHMVSQINIQLEEIKLANNLSPSELLRYDWRIKVFLKKYANEEPFEFVTGPKKVLVYSPQMAKLIEKRRTDLLQGEIFLGRNKKLYSISDLKMTKEFQEFQGHGIEAKEIKNTVAQISEAKSELVSAVIPIRISNDLYEVSSIEKTQGSPKSDFHFLNQLGREIVWISHKDGRRAVDFQQWSGMTEKGIIEADEIQDFISSVKVMFPLGIDKGVTVARKVESKDLRMKSVYGVDYGGPFGKQNVTVVMQGPIDIRSSGQYYRVCSNHVLTNGEEASGDYAPTMMAIYKGDRDQFGVKGARFTIQPVGSRKINDFI